MIKLPKLDEAEVTGKKVFLRADLDIDTNNLDKDALRLDVLKPVVDKIFEKGAAKLFIVGHIGRPQASGVVPYNLSTVSLQKKLEEILERRITFRPLFKDAGVKENTDGNNETEYEIVLLENLRINKGEEGNDELFAKELASLADVYVNEAFAVSHREHASIVGVPKFIPHCAGIRLSKEVEVLSSIMNNPKKPVVTIISGVKEDKLNYIVPFLKFSDKILIGGRLPEYVEKDSGFKIQDSRILVAKLIVDKEDITLHSIESFEKEVEKAGTVIVSGPLGKFEEEGYRLGTERVLKAIVANKPAFKVAGGGETEKVLDLLNLKSGFDWVSVGGGAMLEFLAKGTLPGIEALLN